MHAEEEAKRMLAEGRATCVVVKGGEIVRAETGPGVSPLLSLYEKEPEVLQGACVFDKIIGKAAAMLLVLGGAREAYGAVMGDSARLYLAEHGCAAGFGRTVDFIRNRAGDGLCPLERAVAGTEDPRRGCLLLKQAAARLRAAPQKAIKK